MFKFNFQVDSEDNNPFATNDKETYKEVEVAKVEWYDAEEISPHKEILENLDVYSLNSTQLIIGDATLNHIIPDFILDDIRHNSDETKDIAIAEENHSDLIPGVYEGGAKIWECTNDLLKYLQNWPVDDWQGKRVLDLGCGAGLLGIYAYKRGSHVHFQDYNKDVLQEVMIPNLLLNTALPPNSTDFDLLELKKSVQFYCGDWKKYAELTDDEFDIILTSETIYNPDNQMKLLDTLYKKLKRDGVVLLAAKTHYFGVGGGLRQFEKLIEDDKRFHSQAVWTSSDGICREILELKKKNNNVN